MMRVEVVAFSAAEAFRGRRRGGSSDARRSMKTKPEQGRI
jgi:hypothetical protein